MKKKLDYLLETLETNIDLDHLKEVENIYVDVLDYKPVPYLPLNIIFPIEEGLTLFPYGEAFENPEKMLYNELLLGVYGTSVYNSVMLKDHLPLQIRSNHGVGILSTLFGAACRIVNNSLPWVDHLGPEDLKKIISRGIPNFNQALGQKVMETNAYYHDKLGEYPQCYKAIRITQPDLQGPFDILHLLMGNQVFYDLYEAPGMLHELLDIITETYSGFRKHIEQQLTHSVESSAVYVHSSIYGGKVLLKDDTALINISDSMYEEFSKTYNDRILAAFQGGSIHYCGSMRPWHFNSIQSKWLKGINYGNPEMHDLRDTYDYWKERKVPLIQWGYNQPYEKIQEVYESGIRTGISLATQAEDIGHARLILEQHYRFS